MTTAAPEILKDLNPGQREAVETLSGPLLILAGAGSGKTRVVTRRIANLLAHGTRPWEILAITFTNKAAGEMRERVEALVGTAGIWLSTFHSFCARLLRREAAAMDLSPDFTIYDEEDAREILAAILREMGLEDRSLTAARLRRVISGLKSRGLQPEDLEESSHHERQVQQIYTAYRQRLLKNQALDFDDLLLKAVELLRGQAAVRERYAERFRQILVDEYQDTNGCQYQLIGLLGGRHRNICVTGDPDQSIYSWRGADVRNILSFERDYPEARVVRLEQNYRSTKSILEIAAAVIRHNTERKAKRLWTDNPAGEKPVLLTLADQEEEAQRVVYEIAGLKKAGRACRESAIFYRTNAQSRAFETALLHAGLPYQVLGGTPFYERREVKDALAYLRLLVNPRDDLAFRRIVNVPRRGLGEAAMAVVTAEAGRRGLALLEACRQGESFETSLKTKPRQALRAFVRLMDHLAGLPRQPVAECVRGVIEKTGLLKELKEAGEEERVENVEQLVTAAAVHDRQNTLEAGRPGPEEPGATDGEEEYLARRASLAGFLENAALVAPTDTWDDEADRVILMTLHMAKGLEFPFVFLTGLEDGLLPLYRRSERSAEEYDAESERRQIEEERRLFYVGATRARERLWLSLCRCRMRYGKTDRVLPSRFVNEIPADAVAREEGPGEAGGGRFDPYARAPGRMERAAFSADWEENEAGHADETGDEEQWPFQVGDQVWHRLYGAGTVEALKGNGLSRKIEVKFKGQKTATLLLSLTQLKKL